MKKKISILSAILAALCMGISVQAETEVIRITDNGYEDILPAVHGNYLVWQGQRDGEWEIFLYNIATAQTQQITDNDYPDMAPQTDGRYVVWLGMNNTGGNIFCYDTAPTGSGLITQLTTDNEIITIKSPPRIADGRIAWTSQILADSVLPGEIELYDIETGTSTTISAPVDPDGSLSITTKFDGHDKEIFLSHQRLRKNMQITDNDVEEKHPKIHGNHLVWVSGRGEEQEIYLGIIRLLSPLSPGDDFVFFEIYPVFEWEAIGYDRFRVQFSSTKDFTVGDETFTFPPLSDPDPWLYENSLIVANDDMGKISNSPYWRIIAQDQYGNETTSQVRRIENAEKKK